MGKIGVEGAFQGRGLPKAREQFTDDTETSVVHIRLHRRRRDKIKELFNLQGMDMNTGIRSVLYDWLYNQLKNT